MLTNDHKRVTNQIEQLMHELHAEARSAPAVESAKRPKTTEASSRTEVPLPSVVPLAATPVLRPFAVIDEVSSSSPAEEAGLVIGDQLLAFADITGQTQNCLPSIATALQVCCFCLVINLLRQVQGLALLA